MEEPKKKRGRPRKNPVAEKRKLTPEELSAIRHESAMKSVEARRASGWKNVYRGGSLKRGASPSMHSEDMTTMYVWKEDQRVFSKIANTKNCTICAYIHALAEEIKASNPSIFS